MRPQARQERSKKIQNINKKAASAVGINVSKGNSSRMKADKIGFHYESTQIRLPAHPEDAG